MGTFLSVGSFLSTPTAATPTAAANNIQRKSMSDTFDGDTLTNFDPRADKERKKQEEREKDLPKCPCKTVPICKKCSQQMLDRMLTKFGPRHICKCASTKGEKQNWTFSVCGEDCCGNCRCPLCKDMLSRVKDKFNEGQMKHPPCKECKKGRWVTCAPPDKREKSPPRRAAEAPASTRELLRPPRRPVDEYYDDE